ncbi:MAG: hybrid sensor histidine kinase/response regulator [Oscillatoriaceae bacterium SKYG93]|nr:hybrid sensor histidine kinase/response regulator [Oscillatoriaceae bacterium SKYG93]MDW8454158.1 hybrid sensor histidine kinase/response regulator [Oscillatoriaceae cyanobacterium SKYGB_i_bin93]
MIKKNLERDIILIVDDNQTNLDVLFEFLREEGFKVLVATDGETALEQLEYIKPDIILLDVMMPGIDGFETCRLLKAKQTTQDIPVIFITALSDTVDKVKGFQMGAVDYITKPFQHEEVLMRVQTHLTLRKLQKQLQEKNEELAALNRNLENLVEQKTKQLIEREKTAIIGRLTQGMIHNIKNPLQTIMTSLDMIELRAAEIGCEEVFKKYCNFIDAAAEKINNIIENLMLKSRRDEITDLQLLNLNDLVKNELHFFSANLFFKNHIKTKVFLDNNLPSLWLNYSYMSQVFHNLIDNAIHAMWKKSIQEITIVTRQDENNIYLDIQDTGCGIAPENISKIFDPFYTSKPAKDEESEVGAPTGTGLGLYTCLELLKPFQGEIKVTSELGKGSVFTVVLPKQDKKL